VLVSPSWFKFSDSVNWTYYWHKLNELATLWGLKNTKEMILLQAAMGAGMILFVFLLIFLIFGVPLLTGILMKMLWRILGKEGFIKNKKAYYKDPLLYYPCLICSIIILVFIYCRLILLMNLHFY
jgi:hypothetical protein